MDLNLKQNCEHAPFNKCLNRNAIIQHLNKKINISKTLNTITIK